MRETIINIIPARYSVISAKNPSNAGLNINEILSHKETNFAGTNEIRYTCNAFIGDELKMFELKYSVIQHKWSFFQMLS